MIKAEYLGVSNDLLQSGESYEIRTRCILWKGRPMIEVMFGERFRYCVHYGSIETFLKYWKVRAVYNE